MSNVEKNSQVAIVYFTAPKVKPETMYLCMNTATIITGITAIVPTAQSWPQSRPLSMMNPLISTGRVRVLKAVS